MNGQAVEVREAIHEEIPSVLACYEWLFAPPGSVPPQWDPEAAATRLADSIDSPEAAILVAVGAGRIVGLCTAYLDLISVRFGSRCWVEDLAVDPTRRSEGIGASLMAAAREWAVARGASHLELDSGEARPDAHRFYEREDPSWRSVSYGWLLNGGES